MINIRKSRLRQVELGFSYQSSEQSYLAITSEKISRPSVRLSVRWRCGGGVARRPRVGGKTSRPSRRDKGRGGASHPMRHLRGRGRAIRGAGKGGREARPCAADEAKKTVANDVASADNAPKSPCGITPRTKPRRRRGRRDEKRGTSRHPMLGLTTPDGRDVALHRQRPGRC